MDLFDRLIIVTPPKYYGSLKSSGFPLAHMAYVADGDHLFRREMPSDLKGGLMVLTGDFSKKCITAVLRECLEREFSGILADISGDYGYLVSASDYTGLKLFLPETLTDLPDNVNLFVQTAISKGNLRKLLIEKKEKFGASRLSAVIERTQSEFSPGALPERVLNDEELNKIITANKHKSFFSGELCTHYMLIRDTKGYRFLLYDDSRSILKKLSIIAGLDYKNAFLHVEDYKLLTGI